MRICIVGAGIIGCATAYRLARQGHDVQLLDALAEPGLLTSFANGAQLSYSYVEPFASPATLRGLPGMLASSDSPVRFSLKADPHQWAWLMRFVLACRTDTARRGTASLLELARLSRLTLDAWMAQESWAVSFAQNGKLVLCPDARTLKKQEAQVRLQATLGSRQEVLTRAECVLREPALANASDDYAGGIWTADECVADPHQLCQALVRGLRTLGGRADFGIEVSSFVREGERCVAARTAVGDVAADQFVLAAGPRAAALARSFDIALPIYPIKGYSITLPFATPARPRASVTDLGRKTVFAPLGDSLRVAAMAEIGGDDLGIPAQRVATMAASVEALYPGLCDLSAPRAWAGLRPATPTSVPIVARVRQTNLWLNAGHGALGLTLAAGSAVRLCELIERDASGRS